MTRRLEAGPLLVTLGALLLLVSLFLSWYAGEITAWEAFEVWDLVLFVLALGSIAAGLGLTTQDVDLVDRRYLPAAVAVVARDRGVADHRPASGGGRAGPRHRRVARARRGAGDVPRRGADVRARARRVDRRGPRPAPARRPRWTPARRGSRRPTATSPSCRRSLSARACSRASRRRSTSSSPRARAPRARPRPRRRSSPSTGQGKRQRRRSRTDGGARDRLRARMLRMGR